MRLSAAERDVRRVGRPRANGLSYHLSTNWRESERLQVTCRKEKGLQHLVPLYRHDGIVTDDRALRLKFERGFTRRWFWEGADSWTGWGCLGPVGGSHASLIDHSFNYSCAGHDTWGLYIHKVGKTIYPLAISYSKIYFTRFINLPNNMAFLVYSVSVPKLSK